MFDIEQILLILIGTVMSNTPKIVKINLPLSPKKPQTSPTKKNIKEHSKEIQQFSFSEDHPPRSPIENIPQKSKPSPPVAKKLFDYSPKKSKNQHNVKNTPEKTKHSVDKIRQKYRKMNPNYEKIDQTDKFFKKSIEKLKSSFFKSDKNSKQATKKILKEIGKYAQSKSKQYPIKQFVNPMHQMKKTQPVPADFHEIQKIKFKSTQKQRQQFEKNTYLNFQKAYQISIESNNKQINNIDYTNQNVEYVNKQSKKTQSFFQDHDEYKPEEKDSIGQKQIDIICQIFEFCEKYSEDDTIDSNDLNKFISQLERIYTIKSAQHTQDKKYQHLRPQARFYNLLKTLQENLRVIFYRKNQNNIYDALFYLRQSNHLQIVCEDFIKIKECLNL